MVIVMKGIIGVFIFAEGVRDFLYRKISVSGIVSIAVLGLVLQISIGEMNWISVVGGIVVGGCLLLVSKITDEAIGYGDGWIMAAMGVGLGFRDNFLLMCIAFVLCAAVSLLLLIFKKVEKKTVLPFVSFLFPAYILVCVT